MLNALTVKAKFPIPVVDELLDELSSARWFSCLDLRSGFNQIRLAPGEEHKTAFRFTGGSLNTLLCPLASLEHLQHSKAQ